MFHILNCGVEIKWAMIIAVMNAIAFITAMIIAHLIETRLLTNQSAYFPWAILYTPLLIPAWCNAFIKYLWKEWWTVILLQLVCLFKVTSVWPSAKMVHQVDCLVLGEVFLALYLASSLDQVSSSSAVDTDACEGFKPIYGGALLHHVYQTLKVPGSIYCLRVEQLHKRGKTRSFYQRWY